MPFEFEIQKIEDVILVKPKVFGDNRGFFMEAYKKSEFFENGIAIATTIRQAKVAACFKNLHTDRKKSK